MRHFTRCMQAALSFSILVLIAPNRGPAFQNDGGELPPPAFSVETRGPVHEAFAQPNVGKVETSIPISKEPPPALPERPPEQRPDNPNVEWIPGYWAWDSDRNDFLWLTGTFRDPPPGRRWLPGHWTNSAEGWRWVPGFWAGENQQELRYTGEPPAALENGPLTAPPDDNSTYVPGYWFYNAGDQSFAWRPGYWAGMRDGRVWVNPQYCWTPNGYVFVDGYWDYPLDARGVLFAPAYFPTPLWNNANWFYQPAYGVNLGVFFGSGFYRPGFNHYYFGNYYGNHYAGQGYRPWWGGSHNSLANYHNWQNRNNPQWAAQQQLFNARMNGKAPLPPSTLAQQNALLNAKAPNNHPAVVTPISHFTPTNGRMIPNTITAAQNFQIRQTHDMANLRTAAESKLAPSTKVGANMAPASLKLPPAPPHVRPLGVPNTASLVGVAPAVGNRGPGANAISPASIGSLQNGAGRINTPAIVNNHAPAIHAPTITNGLGQTAAPRPAMNSAAPIHLPGPPQIHSGVSGMQGVAAPRIINNAPAPQIHNNVPHVAAPSYHAPSAMPARSFSPPSMGRSGPAHMGGAPHMGGGMPHASGGGHGGHR